MKKSKKLPTGLKLCKYMFISHQSKSDETKSKSQSTISSPESQVKPEIQKDDTNGLISEVKTEEVDLDLNDPSLAKAALLFQSGFRGLQARLKFKSKVRFVKSFLIVFNIILSFMLLTLCVN